MNAVAYQFPVAASVSDARDLLDELSRLQAAVALILDPHEDAPVVDRNTWLAVAGAFDALRYARVVKPKLLTLARRAVEDMLDPQGGCGGIGREELFALFTVMSRAQDYVVTLMCIDTMPSGSTRTGQRVISPHDKALRERSAVVDLFAPMPAH